MLLLPLLGCVVDPGSGPVDGRACTREARASVQALVTDEAGERVEGATVSWTADGAGGDCEPMAAGGKWVCGWEQAGEITVTAGAPGYTSAEATVVVSADACHVITEEVTIALGQPDCDDRDVAAVELRVAASTGGPVAEALAYYVPSDEDWDAPGECDPGLDGLYWCAWERSGDLDVWVTAPGWTGWSETITVGHDGCHPITEVREVVLSPE